MRVQGRLREQIGQRSFASTTLRHKLATRTIKWRDDISARIPPELAAQSFTKGSEAAWRPDSAPKVVEWLGQNGFAVLGTELWIVRDDRIQPGIIVNGVCEIHGNTISHTQNESWDAYVSRSAQETLRYFSSFAEPPEAKQQGDVFFDVVWVSESDFLNLKMQ
jgi:hypothetical protein